MIVITSKQSKYALYSFIYLKAQLVINLLRLESKIYLSLEKGFKRSVKSETLKTLMSCASNLDATSSL